MRLHRRALQVGALGALLAASACEVVDRVRGRGVAVDTSGVVDAQGPLTLRMQTPGVLRLGTEGVVRISLTNQADTVPRDVRLDLLVPSWVEPVAPRSGDREVTIAASEEGTRFSYRMEDPPLEPGQTQVVEQRIRIPPNPAMNRGAIPWSRVIRARLVSASGQSLAEVESEVLVDTTAEGDSARLRQRARTTADRDRLGPVRLGMTAAALRQAVSGARDTTWMSEGQRERGVVVPFERDGRAIAVLASDTVSRIEVRDTILRTREGLGVGSRLADLRAAYGSGCLSAGEGGVVAWFPDSPGISFALDAAIPEGATPAGESLERVPASARVTRWWLRRGTERCP